MPRGSAVQRQLSERPPPSAARDDVLIEAGATDDEGVLEPPFGGEVVLSVPSPEALRETDEVRRVIARAGTGNEPIVVVVEVAEELREEELTAVVEAASRSSRPVILRVIRNA